MFDLHLPIEFAGELMPAYTIPFTAPQRIAGPGNFTGPDISLPMYWPQNVVFTHGGKTRYCFCVNGAQAASGAAVPGIVYRLGQQLPFDVTSLVTPVSCPVQVQIRFQGVQRRPC